MQSPRDARFAEHPGDTSLGLRVLLFVVSCACWLIPCRRDGLHVHHLIDYGHEQSAGRLHVGEAFGAGRGVAVRSLRSLAFLIPFRSRFDS